MSYARNGGLLQRLAESRGLAPLARRHALVSTEARSARPVDIPNWCWRSGRRTCGLTHQPAYRLTGTASARFRFRPNGARGRTCTCTIEGLSFAPLHWATRAMNGAHGRICTDTSRVLSAPSLRWTPWAKWCRVRDFHPQPLRSERSVSCRWTNAAKIVNRKSHIVNEIGTPGRTLTYISDVRSVALW